MTASSMVCIDDFEAYACNVLPRHSMEFLTCGANDGNTLKENKKAFTRWRIHPRVLRNVSVIDLRTSVLGCDIDFPMCIAPSGAHGLWHHEAELGTARGAEKMKTIFTLSINTNTAMHKIAKCVPDGLHFFQLSYYDLPKSKEFTHKLMKQAEQCGFKAIVFTMDIAAKGERYQIMRSGFKLPNHLKLVEFESFPGSERFFRVQYDRSFTWKDLKDLRSKTKLPFIVKGILSAADALLALDCGVDGIIVSNHGGRQLDTAMATIDVLPEIVSAVNGRCEVYLDSGVRHGTDVFKALALGARAVFIGRPAVYGLVCNGSEGVSQVLRILKQELETVMALTGCSSIHDIQREMVEHEKSFWAKL